VLLQTNLTGLLALMAMEMDLTPPTQGKATKANSKTRQSIEDEEEKHYVSVNPLNDTITT